MVEAKQAVSWREWPAERWFRRKVATMLLTCLCQWRLASDVGIAEDAWIIAPHPDDEVLGCGGTILRKRRLGADVRIVFLTDGSGSHPGALGANELGQRRRGEALSACEKLGVPSDNLFFLGLSDGNLISQVQECSARLAGLFAGCDVKQYFTPLAKEPPEDHQAAHYATLAALAKLDQPATVFSYPIWCWDAWPFVPISSEGGAVRRFGRRIKQLIFSLGWLSQCRAWVDVADLTADKVRALHEHASQAAGLPEAPDAPTLMNLREGEFIQWLTQRNEMFAKFQFSGAKDAKLRR